MPALPQKDRDRIRQMLGICRSSEHDGERLSALDFIGKILAGHGLRLEALAETQAESKPNGEAGAETDDWRDMVNFIAIHGKAFLSRWETDFMETLRDWDGRPTPKQYAVLKRIYDMCRKRSGM